MDHPATINRYTLSIYWFFPLLLAGLFVALHLSDNGLSIGYALVDALVFSIIIGLMGLAVWFAVRYNNLQKNSVARLVVLHSVIGVVFISLWIFLSGEIAKALIDDPIYTGYLPQTVRNRSIIGFLYYVPLVAIYYGHIYGQHEKERGLKQAELEGQVRKAQLNALKFQINPHFLFNSLNSVASLTMSNPGKAHEMVIALSEFMRYSLQNDQRELVALETELRNCELYLKIEKIRFGSKLNYRFSLPNECRKIEIPTLILQPLFENAIKYGVYESSEPVDIAFEARIIPEFLEMRISNDFDPESIAHKGEGVGLENTQNRLRIAYGSSRLFEISKENNRFVVILLIPLIESLDINRQENKI